MAALKNFPYSVVAVAPSPAASGTTLTVSSGQGALFAEGRPAVVYPSGQPPGASNAEIVLVTGVSGDVLTITRTQESTSARTILVGDQIAQVYTAGAANQIETDIAAKEASQTAASQAEAEAGTEAAIRKWSPLRIAQAIAALAPGGGGDVAADTHAATSKTTPVDADELPLVDSEASWALKKLTWANLKATLKTYFDGIYSTFNGAYSSLTGIPSTFTPSSHSHAISDTTGLQTALDGKAADSALTSHTGNTSNPHSVTKDQVGLTNVTDDAQTKAAVVPNTAPSAGQLLVGNAGGTAYAPVSASGDVTVASTGAVTIANSAVTLAKMENRAASKLIGRGDSGTGAPQEITLGSGLSMSGTTLSASGGSWVSGLLFTTTASTKNIDNSTAETSIFSGTVPGGTLGTQGCVHVVASGIWLNNSGSNATFTLKIKYGATTLFEDVSATLTSTGFTRTWQLEFRLFADNSTSAQRLAGTIAMGTAAGVTTGYGDIAGTVSMGNPPFGGTSAEDSTANKTLDVTITLSLANDNTEWTTHKASAWKL